MIDFKIKICGITTIADANRAVVYGADAIGLNFYSKSMRSISVDRAREIVSALEQPAQSRGPKWVGVFVNETIDAINHISESVGLDFVQLHGDESPDLINQIQLPIIRAVRVQGFDDVRTIGEIKAWVEAGVIAILLDKSSSGEYGGTGLTLDWQRTAKFEMNVPLILAGGLRPENVAQAISIVKPQAVDVASGVEKFPGAKDDLLLQGFVSAAKKSFAAQ